MKTQLSLSDCQTVAEIHGIPESLTAALRPREISISRDVIKGTWNDTGQRYFSECEAVQRTSS